MSPPPSARRRVARSEQQSLNFDAIASVEAKLYDDASAAPAADRAFAAVVDSAIPLTGFALFLAAFQFMAGGLIFDQQTLPFFGASLLLLIVFYRAVCCIGGIDTPGLQCARLRLLNFDGRRPGRRARFHRQLGGIVSTAALGIGLLWALLDEDRLAWHDHMSGTFPARRTAP